MKLEVVDYFYITTFFFLGGIVKNKFCRLFSNRWTCPCRMVPWHFLLWFLAATGGAAGAAAVTGVASAAPQAFWDWLLWGTVERVRRCRFSGHFLVS